MTDQTTEKLQNVNIQDFDGSEFDPYSPQGNMVNNQPNGGGFEDELTNGHGKHVNFGGDVLPPGSLDQLEDTQVQKARQANLQRNMSEGEVLGYQTEYGESMITGQMEYGVDSDDEANSHSHKRNYGHVENDYLMSTGQPLVEFDNEVDDSGDYVDQDGQDAYGNAEAAGDSAGYGDLCEAGQMGEPADTPGSWHPQMDAERSRRSLSPERSISPNQDMSGIGSPHYDSSPSDVPLPQLPGQSDESQSAGIPQSDTASVTDSQSIASYSESDMLSPRPRKKGIPKPKSRKVSDLPPWDDNVVIPPPPRMKPTLIGKQADLPPPPPSPHRPKSAHSRKADGSSDSGVEEDKSSGLKSPRKSSAEVKKKYGTDSKNTRYKPGGGNIQVVSQRLDLKSVGPRTDSTAPRSAISARNSPAPSERSITSPKPSPNTMNARSKIGSLNNVKHSPGGGNVQVLNAKVDYSNVRSKVGSKDKLDHKPKGGDKKIDSRKLDWKTESRVGSLKNAAHTPGGGNVKAIGCSIEEDAITDKGDNLYFQSYRWKVESQRLSWSAKSRIGSLDNATHTPGGGKVKILDQKLEVKAQSKVGSTANLKHKPGGGDKRIETVKLDFTEKAKSKVGSLDKVTHKPGGGDIKIFNENPDWKASSRVESLKNVTHKPGGGDVVVLNERLAWSSTARVGSMSNLNHIPNGGDVQILDEKVDFSQTASPRVGSLDKVKHKPGGGDKQIETQKLNFKETAKPRTDTGVASGEKPRSHDSHSRSASVTSSQDGSFQG